MVIRAFHPFDVARFARGDSAATGNRAHTLSDLGRDSQPRLSLPGIVGSTASLQARGVRAFTWAADGRVKGIAAARPRSGPEAYDIVYLLASDGESGHGDLLRRVCQDVASKGGEKVFLRLRSDDDLVDVALHRGFIRYEAEVLFKGTSRSTGDGALELLRKRRASDDYGLFQLYNASMPVRTRAVVGVTFNQWSCSRDRSRGRRRELVYERDGSISAWLSIAERSGVARMQMMVHPDEDNNTGELMDSGLARLRRGRTVYAIAQEHQVLLQRLLAQRGYHHVCEFAAMVRSMVVPVSDEQSRRAISVARP